jgi:hypothetical protein
VRHGEAMTHNSESNKVTVPEGISGPWRIERFTITEGGARLANLRMTFGGHGYRSVRPGVFTKLVGSPGGLMMSDTPAEIRDHWEPIERATGTCLVNGLGIGMVIQAMLRKPEVDRVDVVEVSSDVIALVAPHYQAMFGDRLRVIHADALTWRPAKGVRYDVVWHDIWRDICLDNLDQIKLLKRAYGRRCDWQGVWGEPELHELKRRERQWNYSYGADPCSTQ